MLVQKPRFNFIIFTLMITIMIDIMGMGLVFPLYPQLFLMHGAALMSATASQTWRYYAYGLGMATWPLGIFFGGPLIGDISDRFGRKRTLVIAVFLTAIAYVFSGVSVYVHSLCLFLISRFMSGFVSGAWPLCQATVADISPDHLKARNLGWITMAASIGFLIGPIITSITSNSDIVSWFNIDTPFWIAALLSLLNVLSILMLVKDTYPPIPGVKINLLKAFTAFKMIFVDARIRWLSIAMILLQAGWGFYCQGIPIVLNRVYGFATHEIGYFYSMIGLVCFLGVTFFQPYIFRRFQLKPVAILSGIISGAVLLLSIIFHSLLSQWGFMVIAVLFELFVYSALMALLSNAVTEKEQGKVMGSAASMFGIAWLINGFLLGGITNLFVKMPIIAAGLLILLTGAMMIIYRVRPRELPVNV